MNKTEPKQEKKQYEPPFLTDIHPVSIIRGSSTGGPSDGLIDDNPGEDS
jgi:hypothetical protein